MHALRHSSAGRILPRLIACLVLSIAFLVSAEPEARRRYSLSAGDAETTLREFSSQSGRGVLFPTRSLKGIRTNAISGEYTAREAIDAMTAGTPLRVRVETTTGAFSIKRESTVPNDPRASAEGSVRPNGEKQSPTEESPIKLETFEVFGSKSLNMDIRRSQSDAQPYVVFKRETIETSGAVNLESFLKQRLTMNAQGATNAQTPNSVINKSISQVNLRGLGTNQTLILIDGHRAPSVNLLNGAAQPDINGIPLSAIDRIEVLPTTASGIYGGGATGGVINIILKRNYSGLEAALSYGNTFDGDTASRRLEFSAGVTSRSGSTHLVLYGSVSDSNDLVSADRQFVERGRALILRNNPAYLAGLASPPLGALPNVRSANGSPLFGLGTPNFATVPLGYTGGGGIAPFLANAGVYNLEPSPSAYGEAAQGAGGVGLLPKTENTALSVVAQHSLSDRVQLYLSGSWSTNRADMAFSPQSPVFTVADNAPNNPFGKPVLVSVPMDDANGRGRSENELYGIVAGAVVKLPADWKLGADIVWDSSVLSGDYPPSFLPTATAAIRDGVVDVLRDFSANPLDLSSYLVGAPLYEYTDPSPRSESIDIALRGSGPVVSLPAGQAVLSGYIEHRKTTLDYSGFLFPGFGVGSYYPSRWQAVESAYLEASVPLLGPSERRPFVQKLDVQLAGRADRYRTKVASPTFLGSPGQTHTYVHSRLSSVNPTVAVKYVGSDDIALRASFGTGFKVPEISQFSPGSLGFDTGKANDLRRGNTLLGRYDRIPGGNLDLKPEKSESFSVGTIVTPRRLDGFRVSVDYTRIKKRDNIITPTPQQLLDNEALFPERIRRGSNLPGDAAGWAGPVTFLDVSALNVATAEVEAFDVQGDYEYRSESLGRFGVFAYATWQTHYLVQLVPTSSAVENVGLTSANPLKLRANFGGSWQFGGFNCRWTANYYNAYRASANPADILNQGGDGTVPSQVYHDVSLGYRFARTERGSWFRLLSATEIRVTAENIFNREPPPDVSAASSLYYSYQGDPRLSRYLVTVRRQF